MNLKTFLYTAAAFVICMLGLYFYMSQEIRIIKKQFAQEREVWDEERADLISSRYKAIDSTKAAQKPIYREIDRLTEKGKQLERKEQIIKIKRNEINDFIRNASEPVLDSVLRSN